VPSAALNPGSSTPAWLEGPVPDLLLGAGGAYLLSVPLLLVAAAGATAAHWPFAAAWAIAILINGPHYGATLLRVYERPEERRRYARVAVGATLLLSALFAAGLYEPLVGSLLVTAYVTWSPWHFAGQNYGVAMTFLGRSGVAVAPRVRRLLHASFVLSFLLACVALHAEGSRNLPAPGRSGDPDALSLLRLGIPLSLAGPLLLAGSAAYLVALAGAALGLVRTAGARVLLPVGAIALCQALWFAVPAFLDVSRPGAARPLVFAALWISAAHSLQYLWVTYHFARRGDASTRLGSYLLRATLAGNAAIVVPGIAAAPALLGGSLSWEGGLGALVFSVVNLHHFVLDGAVWKLRDRSVAGRLLRDEAGPVGAPSQPAGRRWGVAAAWAVGAACLAIEVAELTREQAQRRGAHALARRVLDGLEWVGRDHAAARLRFGRSLLESGDYAAARVQFETSAGIRPTVAAFGGLGRALERQGDRRAAADAYEAGLVVEPDDAALLRSAARTRLELGDSGRAVELLERALALEPDHAPTRRALARARASAR
jgi:hypothetical protein